MFIAPNNLNYIMNEFRIIKKKRFYCECVLSFLLCTHKTIDSFES